MDDFYKVAPKPNQLVIAFSGPSTCGKSTVIKSLIGQYNDKIDITVLLLDTFFFNSGNIPKTKMRGETIMNYDLKQSINWESYFQKFKKTDTSIIFLDGFITFADERSQDIVDILITFEYNIDTDFELALSRRIHRKKMWRNIEIPKDYLENSFVDKLNYSCTYFHDVVWQEMLKHPEYRKPSDWNKPILILSATDSIQNNIEKTKAFLRPFLEEKMKSDF
ncbi:hypothetical protein TRFO_16764 [Tritrichomonas foetus]|uniref:ATPase AAA-type core domain-containing protein n=1 Tax=Tritrichomonas foetus TaxID=1144522 RepID=A0A1J4KPG8_9EUKA|nr:hypothetical protein TRFO_16764 [Tritrichomonas foetus]|eukprot:OHT13201.1 hypothetical protein TRFO_16764 [Tritrichomonas foetus]